MELSTAGLLVVLVSLGVVIVIVLEHRLRRIIRNRRSAVELEPGAAEAEQPDQAATVSAGIAVAPDPLVVAPADLPGAAVPSLPEAVMIGASQAAPVEVRQPSAVSGWSATEAALETAHETSAGSAEAGLAAGHHADSPPDPAAQLNSSRDGSWLSLRHHTLMQGETELGELVSRFRDQPWLECTFHASPAFERVRPLFDRELQLLEHAGAAFDKKAFVEQWQRIFAAGVWIRVDSTGARVRHFLLHVHADGSARLRYG